MLDESAPAFVETVARLRDGVASRWPGWLREMVDARDEVLARFGPIFQPDHLPRLTADEVQAFLRFENNRHWSGLHRMGGRLCGDMDRLREALSILLDESRPLAKRYDEAVGRVPGMGRNIASAILLMFDPTRYGVWNATSDRILRRMGLLPELRRGATSGERYAAINEVIGAVADAVGVDLWTQDALWWFLDGEGEKDEDGEPRPTTTWIFRADPAHFDLDGALEALDELTWIVTGGRDVIAPGDRVLLWEAGPSAGIVAVGEVLDEVAERPLDEAARPFVRHDDLPTGLAPRVRVRVARRVEPRLPSEVLRADPLLADLEVLHAASGTHFAVTPEQAQRLDALLPEGRAAGSALLARLLPDPEQRRACLEVLADAIEQAAAHGADRWSLSTTTGVVRLNVGRVQAVILEPETLHLVVDDARLRADAGDALDAFRTREPGGYRSEPSASDLRLPARRVAELVPLAPPALRAVVDAAARTVCPYRRHHDAAMVDIIAEAVGRRLPQPHRGGLREAATLPGADDTSRPDPRTAGADAPPPDFDSLLAHLERDGLSYPAELVFNYLLALQTRRFVLLTGISGTGKTQLAIQVARRLTGSTGAGGAVPWLVVAVRPDWTDPRALLGFHNSLTGRYVQTPALRLLLAAAAEHRAARAAGRLGRPHFLILDEMNLARVEHYFSDFLSAMESGEPVRLHDEPRIRDEVPTDVVVPPNLFLVGTVNVDETTYMFSPKVLDRAFTLALDDVDLAGYGADRRGRPRDGTLRLERFDGRLDIGRRPSRDDWERFGELEGGALRDTVVTVHEILAEEHRHFGYRVANEIARFVELARRQTAGDAASLWAALDLALLQKTLPKLHGTQQELEPLLLRLACFALGASEEVDPLECWTVRRGALVRSTDGEGRPRLPRTAAKLLRMLRRVRQQGFTAFVE